MAETPKRAPSTQAQLGTSSATIYTYSGASWALIRRIHCISTPKDAAVNLTVGIGANNTDAAEKRVVSEVTVVQGENYDEDVWIPLAPNEVVYALAGEAASLTLTLGILEGP